MKRLLFVCMGNICRSPTGEAVFRDKAKKAGIADHFLLDSAGTLDAHTGSPADPRMRAHALRRGYVLDSIARGVRPEDFERFDLILAMDEDNLQDLLAIAPNSLQQQKIRRLMDFAPHANTPSVPDPYYGGAAGFEHVLDLVEEACEGLLRELSP